MAPRSDPTPAAQLRAAQAEVTRLQAELVRLQARLDVLEAAAAAARPRRRGLASLIDSGSATA
jgi:capsule polysaccharide export protein KpsE/RkpR